MVDKNPGINIIEVDSRSSQYQTGIGRYFDVLRECAPKNIKTLRIIFYRSANSKEIRIVDADDEISIFHPPAFPANIMFETVIQFIGARLRGMKNLIVKCNCLGFENFAYALKSRVYCKTIGILHCLPHNSPESIKNRKQNPNTPMFPILNPYHNMDHIIIVCNAGKEWLAGCRNERPFSVIYNGVARPGRPQAQKPDDGIFRFIFANGLSPRKGFAKIIPAISTVAKKHKIRVYVLGGSEGQEKILSEIKKLPVTYVGLLTDSIKIQKYYEMADCALFASDSEACSFSGIEAMANKLPVITTTTGGPDGLDEMFDRTALGIPMDAESNFNPDEYAAAMTQVIESKTARKKLSLLSHARYLEQYTADRMIKDTVKLYKKLLGL